VTQSFEANLISYRCYILDAQDKIASADSVQAANDVEALQKAAARIETSILYPAVEVWHERRLVGRVP
jgi:hypothetical protein